MSNTTRNVRTLHRAIKAYNTALNSYNREKYEVFTLRMHGGFQSFEQSATRKLKEAEVLVLEALSGKGVQLGM